MRNLLLLFLLLSVEPAPCPENSAVSTQHTNTVAFYFGAHPDDWQLFMNPNAYYEENMTGVEREIETGTFAALSIGVTALDHPSPWDRLHRSWLNRHYFRIEPGVRSASPGRPQ